MRILFRSDFAFTCHFPRLGENEGTMDTELCIPTVHEAAQMLGVSRDLAYRGVNDGTIPAIRIGKRIVVPRKRLEKLLAEEDT